MVDHPLGVIPENFWVLESRSIEGLYISKKLMRTISEKDHALAILLVPIIGGALRTYLHKDWFAADLIQRHIGIPIEESMLGVPIQLSTEPRPDLPEPNVPYWGEA